MKRFFSLVLIVAILFSFTGCLNKPLKDSGAFYYRRTDPLYDGPEGIIAPENRELDGIRSDLDRLLELYFSGPVSRELESPFPRDTLLLDWSMENYDLCINLNEAFAQLSGIDLTVACSCIAKTFLELTDAAVVHIHANGAPLNGADSITLSKESYALYDDSIDKLRTDLALYYTDADRRYLIGHNVSINLAAQDDVVGYLVQRLMKPPHDLDLVSALPEETLLLDWSVTDRICALNFSSGFETDSFVDSYAQRTTLLSLVNTLTQLEGIDGVEFYLEGNLMARYGHLSLFSALVFEEGAIGPVRTGVNEFDATLYLANGSDYYLTAVPTRVRQNAGISQPELVVQELLSYQGSNGFSSTIPADTVLNHITTENGHCIVDLSPDFLKGNKNLALSVHSIIASVCALEEIQSAQITIDGTTPIGNTKDLFLPMSPNSDWYL